MKRRFALAFGVLVLVAVLFGTISWSLGTCRLLDRILGFSGCRGSVAVTHFSVIQNVTMSPPDVHGISSLFGSALTADGASPALIRLDPATGDETARYPLRLQFDVRRVTLADDGRRAALDCITVRRCTENGGSISVVSLNDGTEIETRDAW